MHRLTLRSSALIGSELLLILGVVTASAYVKLGADGWPSFVQQGGLIKAFLVTAVCQLCLYYCDAYDLRTVQSQRDLIVRLLQALGATSLFLAVLYLTFPVLIMVSGAFVWASALVIVLIAGWRVAFDWVSLHAGPHERILIVGTNGAAVGLAQELVEGRREFGVEIVGFIDPDRAEASACGESPAIIGSVEDIPAIVRDRSVDRVVVSLSDARGKLPMSRLLDMKLNQGIRFDHLVSVYEQYTGKIAVENLRPSWFIFSDGFRQSPVFHRTKRVCDIAAATVGLLVGTPVMLVVAAAVKLSSPGPILYEQRRVGRFGRIFTIRKFRSMRNDAEAGTGAVWAQKQDDRVTAVGRFLRRTRLDELPQFWNILIGDMSLIGPRPERPEFVATLTQQIPFYGERHAIRPGLTGWAQVCYTYGASVEDALEKLQYDLFYQKNMSLMLDFVIVFQTLKTVLLRRGAN
jgi:sugar transferase (PEP-CTERM system associated)